MRRGFMLTVLPQAGLPCAAPGKVALANFLRALTAAPVEQRQRVR